VGNLLQGLYLYLDLMTSASDQQEIKKLSQSSLMLINDVDAINRQVRILSRIKDKQVEELVPVSLRAALEAAIHEIKNTLGGNAPEIVVSELEQDDYVLADDLLSTIPFNIIMYIIRDQAVGKPQISVKLLESSDHLTIQIKYEGKHISEDVQAALYDSLDPSRTTMGLDIYAAKVLLKNYGGSISYEDTPQGGQFIAALRRTLNRPSNSNHRELEANIDT